MKSRDAGRFTVSLDEENLTVKLTRKSDKVELYTGPVWIKNIPGTYKALPAHTLNWRRKQIVRDFFSSKNLQVHYDVPVKRTILTFY